AARARAAPAAVAAAAALALAGCEGPQSTLDPAGPGAAALAQSWWVMLAGSIAIAVLTIGLALYAVFRDSDKPMRFDPLRIVIGLGLVFPTVTLIALLYYGVRLGQAVLPGPGDRDVYEVEVRAHQWWWEVSYPPSAAGRVLHSANELHVPVGRPVYVRVTGADVIHSFWVPQLGPKIDAMPGITTMVKLQSDRAGTFRGQCAEFCGEQHARMVLFVHAHPPQQLQHALEQLAAAGESIRAAATPQALDAFAQHCGVCHSLDATERGPARGPNLAAVTLRTMLGAGTLENGPQALRQWMREHSKLKPGIRKPSHDHVPDDVLESIVRLLEARS
ncbi:MAG TPA: cytochrome c oxidase subunit II, partial [Burkholderiaceae bacterium]|nr:cytochrome c oxidase subunit II [Burkholderiaceae bacterium]